MTRQPVTAAVILGLSGPPVGLGVVAVAGLAGLLAVAVAVAVKGGAPAHRATTAQLQAIYPFQTPVGLGPHGCYIGTEILGGSFCFDPWQLYETGAITNPNMVIAGQIGRGKSALVKTFIWRQIAFGRKAIVIDPKGEFGPLAQAAGGTVIALTPGGETRLNPLDPTHNNNSSDSGQAQDQVLAALAEAALERPLLAEERAGISLARKHTTPDPSIGTGAAGGAVVTIGDIVAAMLDPSVEAAAEINTTPTALAAACRPAALELRRLTGGDLAGLFDGPTTATVDWDAPLIVLDLSALAVSDDALAVVMAATLGWLHTAVTTADGHKRLVVVDEAWALLSNVATARWLRSSFKLARQYGIANIIIIHRLSDLAAAGPEGSEAARIAQGLLADTETRVIYAQPPTETGDIAAMLNLTATETAAVGRLGQGVALWKVHNQSFIVAHRLSVDETALVDTDHNMRPTTHPNNTTAVHTDGSAAGVT